MTIAYLLHRFPTFTDTFIRREIEALRELGLQIEVISVWKPTNIHVSPELLQTWSSLVTYLLPANWGWVALTAVSQALRHPMRFFSTVRLAVTTSKPGFSGAIHQAFYLAEALLAASVVQKRSIQHLHNHFGDHSGVITMLVSRLTGKSYSISFHGPHVFFDGTNGAIENKVFGAAFIRCISYFCQSQLVTFSGRSDYQHYKVIRCGVRTDQYSAVQIRAQADRLFCSARLAHEKGFEYLLAAMSLLKRAGRSFHLTLAGDGPQKQYYTQLASTLGLLDHVTFLGPCSEDEIARQLGASDIFVLPSLAEGLPVSLMEAMAAGVPVIATNIAGVSELVHDGVTGMLIRPCDPSQLADTILLLSDNHALRSALALNARAKVSKEFQLESEVRKLAHAFRETCTSDAG